MHNISIYQFNRNLQVFFQFMEHFHHIAIIGYIIMYIFCLCLVFLYTQPVLHSCIQGMLMATKSWKKLFESLLKTILLNVIHMLILCLWPFQWTELLKNNTSIDWKEWGYKTSGVKWIWKSDEKSLKITLYYEKIPTTKPNKTNPQTKTLGK